MTSKFLRVRLAVALAGFAIACAGSARAAEPEDEALSRVVELNKKALTLYEALDMEGAAALLNQALELCKSAGLDARAAAARTHIHLGVVNVSGLKNHAQGLAEFREALAIDPKIKITKSLVNPEVQAAFADAQSATAAPTSAAKSLPFPTGQEPPVPAAPVEGGGNGISHPLVTAATQNRAIAIKAQVPPGLGATKIALAYRAEASDEFLVRDMIPIENEPGWFCAEIPVEACQGRQVAYYIEAQDADDRELAHNGTPELPHSIALAPEDAPEAAPATVAASPEAGKGSSPPGLWMVLAVGSGGGYHSGSPEMNPQDTSVPPKDIKVSGFGFARLLHLAPEIGYFHNERLILSAQGRFQVVTGTQDVRIGPHTYQPAKMAFAGLAKATWLLGKVGTKFRPFLSAQAGAGQIRQNVETPASAKLTGCGAGSTCKDTVLGGVGLAGVGAGFIYRLNESLALYAALSVLVGLPDFMVESDLNLGVAVIR
jgi:hypothetical protein